MRKDADLHAEEDKKRREEVETRNEADNAVYRSEKMLKDNQEKIPAMTRTRSRRPSPRLKEALKGSDASPSRSASEKLNEAWQSVSASSTKPPPRRRARQDPAPATDRKRTEGRGPERGQDEGPIIDAEVVNEKK